LSNINVPINDLRADAAGNMLIGTAGKGLMLFKRGAKYATPVPFRQGNRVVTNYHVQGTRFDNKQQLWLFVQGEGICIYDPLKSEVRLVNNALVSASSLETDGKSRIWIGTTRGLVEYSTINNTVKWYTEASGHLTNDNIMSLFIDRNNCLWVATDGGGINKLNTQTGTFTYMQPGKFKKSLTSVAISTVFEDRESRIWIGTLRGGINIIDPKTNRFTTIGNDPLNANSLIDDFVLSFCEDQKGNIWVGTDGGGLSYWDRKKNKYTNYKHVTSTLSNDFITAVKKDEQQDIWIATYGGGINRYHPNSNSFEHYTIYNSAYKYYEWYIWTLYVDKDKTIWAGALNGGLYCYNRQANRFELFDEKLSNVLTLAEDSKGVLWAGTYDALIKVDKKGKKHEEVPTNNPVRAIHEDNAGVLWVGTEGSGLLCYDRIHHTFKSYTETNGLSNNSVLNILEDPRGNLWLGTFNGISKFNGQRTAFKNFYASDGLQSNQLNYNAAFATSAGEFFFGGIKGFNTFSPDSISLGSGVSALRLTDLRIDNASIEQDNHFLSGQALYDVKEITMPYDKAVLSVDYAALEYSTADKISYAYYLEGWDKAWNYVGKLRTANYSHLSEGNYVLHIKATDGEGTWNPQEKIVRIAVLPPWYRSWWAYLLYIAAALGVVRMYLLYQRRQAHLKYEVGIAHIRMEKEKELNEKKLSFFTNISHEFRTPLTLIINPVKEMLYSPEKETDTGSLNIVYRNARRLLSLVDQLLLFRKADSEGEKLRVVRLNFYSVCYEVYLCFIQQARMKHIQYEFECENELLEVYADREKIEVALFNLVSNALKFTPENGTVRFVVKEAGASVAVLVSDTGCGIPAETGDKLFERFYQVHGNGIPVKTGFGIGLYLVKSFVENHKGKISYESSAGKGTSFMLELQKGKEHFGDQFIFEEVEESPVFLEELMGETEELPKQAVTLAEEVAEDIVQDGQVMLVVDDNEQVRQYIVKLFKYKFRLYEAADGEEGLRMARQYMPDLIISDVMMQVMNGIELCHTIKEDAALNHIPVILLTASASAEIKLKGVECGADDYITKPFEKEILVARVESLLKSRSNIQKYFYNEITLQTNNLQISEEYKLFVERCIAIVEEHLDDEDFNIKILATAIGMSHSNLYKKVKAVSGQSVNSFIRFIRLRRAAELFMNTSCNVNEAAYMVGINDNKYFREQFCKLFGINPSEYIKKYRKSFQKSFKLNEKAIKPRKETVAGKREGL
jgi:signal transduction histidine kinase/ligand-binding sensor domain-containing protein/DNA-binding response OmpR family regulator